MPIQQVRTRDNHVVPFDLSRIVGSIVEAGEVIEALRDRIVGRVSLETIKDNIPQKASTADMLVQIETYLEKAKLEDKIDYTNQYMDVINWLMTMYDNPVYEVQDDDVRHISNAFGWAKRIDGYLDQHENRLKSERTDLENRLMKQKNEFMTTLEDITKEVEKFKEINNIKQEHDHNEAIQRILIRIEDANNEIKDINDQEEALGYPVTEFQQADDAKKNIKPYEELWALYRDYKNKMEMWERGPFFDLDAEEVEKDHKFMFQQSNKLNIIFGRMKVPKPAQVAQQHVNQPLIDFKVYLPIIRALTNPGLKKRHWKMIGTVIEMPINRKMDKKLWELKQINIEQYKDKLEEIADSASKEYSNETILKNMKGVSQWPS